MTIDPIRKLYAAFAEEGLEEARAHTRPPARFRASEASKCARQIWYRLMGFRPAPRHPVGKMYGVAGDLDHDLTRSLLEYSGTPVGGVTTNEDGSQDESIFFRTNMEAEYDGVVYPITVTSRADGSLETREGACILEIKGTGWRRYDYLQKAYQTGGEAGALDRIKDKHKDWYLQCQVTMHLAGYDCVYLIPKDRATGTLGVFQTDGRGDPIEDTRMGIHIPKDPDAWNGLLTKFAMITHKMAANEPPKQVYTASSFDCKICSFYYACHGADKRLAAKNKGQLGPEEPTIKYPGPQMEVFLVDVVDEDMDDPNSRYSE